jgi:CO/xanthine dehydrogenase Mo-binding subunit
MKYIGQSVPRIDALSKVKGEAVFASDMVLPNQAYMKMVMARRPHAIVKKVDTSKAEAYPGVLAVLSSKDVPCNEFGYYTYDQPVFCGPSKKEFADRVRYVGDRVAAVIAETETIAAEACKLIEIEYEDLPIVRNVEEALADNAIILHPDVGSNMFEHHKLYNGDIEAGFAQADVIIESDYDTPAQEHAYLQTETGLSYMDENGRLAIVTSGQWGAKDRKQIAHALGMEEDQVRVIYPMSGGAFGGREDISVQIIVGLGVLKLKQAGNPRPVKVSWTREESIIGHCKRHPIKFKAKWGATKDGKLVAAEVRLYADGGAYKFTTSIVTSNAVINALGPYVIPNVKVDAYDIYTNNVPRGAFRGFGGPQAVFCAEQMINKLAQALNMDPVEIRMKNLAMEGDPQTMGAPYPPGISIREVTETCAHKAGWSKNGEGWKLTDPHIEKENNETSPIRRGLGFAVAHKNIGFSYGYPESSSVTIELYGDVKIEKAVIRHGASEVGMGTHTVITQMAADALNIPMECIELISTDTAETSDSGSVSASRMTFFIGNAIKEAAEKALLQWKDEEHPVKIEHTYIPHKTTAPDPETGQCDPNVAYGYTAQAVEISVDTQTGEVKLDKIYCAIDVGKAINPAQVQKQIEGGLVQAAGYATLENFIEKDGQVLTPTLSTYLIPTVLDIPPELDIMVLEIPDPRGPWGARGLGETMIMCLAPAVTAALHDATGVWFDHFPLIPQDIITGLQKEGVI